MPSSGGALITCRTRSRSCFFLVPVICDRSRIAAASSSVLIRSEDGKTCTRFSSRVRSADSSSHATAVFTLVSSVALSRSNSCSVSSRTISPDVAITSPFLLGARVDAGAAPSG